MGVKELLDEAEVVSQERYALELELLSVARVGNYSPKRIAELAPRIEALKTKFFALTDEAARLRGIQS